ncbi:MAG: efflux RND transporter periplasmic adaptor subunit [Muribaculaceae bacterium]|nr:efflux RND transporter periplasmic adaptor subunit [Muribaculaceae bacterium]
MLKHFYYALAIATTLLMTPSCHRNTPEQDGLGHHHHHGHEGHDHEHEGHNHEHEEHNHDHDHEEHDHDHEGHNHNHEGHNHEHEGHDHKHEHSSKEPAGAITLEPEQAEKFGVEVTKIAPAEFSEVVKVSGQIESAPTDQSIITANASGTISFARNITEGSAVKNGTTIATITGHGIAGGDTNEATKAAYDAAKRELERITPLHNEGIVSTKEYNEAKQAYEQAAAAWSGHATGGTAVSRQNGVITQLLVKQGEYVSTGQPIAVISGNTRLTLRADLPEKYFNFMPTVVNANFRPAYSDQTFSIADLHGQRIGGSTAVVGKRAGYLPVYFSFDNNGSAVPGSYAEIYLIGGNRSDVISLPIEAVSEQQGLNFVYVRLDEDCYEKRNVILGNSNGKNIEIKKGLNPGEEVVTTGMIFVKLAESSGAVPEGHSHSH